jgi:4-hydroxy-tetrahydrodipicolinate synthase
MLTPFDARMRVDRGAYRETVAWYLEHGVGGLYANCLSSEMFHLDAAERLLLAADAVAAAGGRVPVAATGNLGGSLAEHVRACRRVAGAGVDVVMLVVPDWVSTDEALEQYLVAVAEQVEAPLGLYECPVPKPYHLGLELIGKLARTGRFVAFKETSCDLEKIRRILEATAGTPLALLQANTPYLLEAVRAGSPGTMSIASIWLPELVAGVIDAAQVGDPCADGRHARLCAMEMVQRVVHPLGTKHLLAKRGLPFEMRSRSAAGSPPPEVLRSLDACAGLWFDRNGALLPGVL